jgi:tetratricopeptide (TPR) repeat protein
MVDLPAKPPTPPTDAELEATIERKLAETAAADGGEKAQRLALLVRGGKQVEAADFAGAETTYREFITRTGTGHDLSFLALEGIAIALEGQGNLEGALGEIETLAGAPGDFYRDQALWHKGRLLEALGRKDDALAAYQLYAQEFPLDQPSLAKAAVRERLAELDPSMALPEERAPGGLGELLVP